MSDDGTLDAFLVKNIGELEAAITYVDTKMDPRLLKEAAGVIDGLVEGPDWHKYLSYETGNNVFFAHRSWRDPAAKPQSADAYWMLEERPGLSATTDYTWLSNFLAAGPGSAFAVLSFWQEYITRPKWKKLLKDHRSDTETLEGMGISYDEAEGALFVTVRLDRDALANAFQNDDFSTVFDPLDSAVATAKSTLPLLNALLEKARGLPK